MLLYDNLDDVKTKLVTTICLFEGKAVQVREAIIDEHPVTGEQEFVLRLQSLNAKAYQHCKLNDPKFNYMNFRLGYSNHSHSAVWWYRIPVRQYRQGLKMDQIRKLASQQDYQYNVDWNFGKPITDMLEGVYPTFEECETQLRTKQAAIAAFHPDFAISWDRVHNDLIVEYKGKQIGCLDKKRDFKPMDEFEHLAEALKEAVA